MKKRLIIFFAGLLVLGLTTFFIWFPGQQSLFAFTMATGIGVSRLQENVDALEKKAIHKQPFTFSEKQFLFDLYECMSRGALLLPPVQQSGKLMARYLDRSGEAVELDKSIFTENRKVQKQMSMLRRRILHQSNNARPMVSPTFYMPDKSNLDSVFGLYFGTVSATPSYLGDEVTISWRAEVPWVWPSYDAVKKKYGRYHAETFPLPNIRSWLFGKQFALRIDNSLGEYLTQLNLAKTFNAFAEWKETISKKSK